MELHGKNFIGSRTSGKGSVTFQGYNPVKGSSLAPSFHEATADEVDQAAGLAQTAFHPYRELTPHARANFLDQIAQEIMQLGDELIARANAETALPVDRLVAERGRTCNQLRMFAELIREGSWVEASIDRAIPDRKPVPKPDLRRMLIPIGPVAVFGASNFPLAFSVAGGDTASALAAGCTVVVKAHPAHPGTSELAARAIDAAADGAGMPEGTFSMVHGLNNEVSLNLVRHSAIKAVGFTGSQQGGRALFYAAASRSEPIPVYAEMGSINPVFVLPSALQERCDVFAEGLKQSVTLGVGQFCTCPGLVVGLADANMDRLIDRMSSLIAGAQPATMLHPGILLQFEEGVTRFSRIDGIHMTRSQTVPDRTRTEAAPTVFTAEAPVFLGNNEVAEELFGPSTMIVRCKSRDEMMDVARSLAGHLTATLQGTMEDLAEFAPLVRLLENRVGRLIFNGFPTGVEVCPSIHHGGPYPATTDVRSTSVGTAAIKRFARPICYQNFPDRALPAELRNQNQRNIWRLVDNCWTKDGVANVL